MLPFPVVRIPEAKRRFKSVAVERTIERVKNSIGNMELAWMFENCFPNTLDTTVDFEMSGGRPDTYVITGDIDAMWLRDSSAQVFPYLSLTTEDVPLRQLNRRSHQPPDPLRSGKTLYANAFYKDEKKISEWKSDATDMKPGVHERKWEVDSLCYTIRLAYAYWKTTGDTSPFNDQWQERRHAHSANLSRTAAQTRPRPLHHFQRVTSTPTDSLPGRGYGNPAKPVGLIFSMFRPSDDATVFPFLIPSNFFAVVSLRQAADMLEQIRHAPRRRLSYHAANWPMMWKRPCANMPWPIPWALATFTRTKWTLSATRIALTTATSPASFPSPYIGAVLPNDPIYLNTRRYVLSASNPYYCQGKACQKRPGGPHVGMDMIWPLGIITRGLTSTDDTENPRLPRHLAPHPHFNTGFMHEALPLQG